MVIAILYIRPYKARRGYMLELLIKALVISAEGQLSKLKCNMKCNMKCDMNCLGKYFPVSQATPGVSSRKEHEIDVKCEKILQK